MRKVLLTIKQPLMTNMPTTGWNSNMVPSHATPKGRFSRTQFLDTQYAMTITKLRVVGIGVPSKNWDFPVLSLGNVATVTLNRASRVKPQSTNIVSRTWSAGVRIPIANAAAAGATPKEILKNFC